METVSQCAAITLRGGVPVRALGTRARCMPVMSGTGGHLRSMAVNRNAALPGTRCSDLHPLEAVTRSQETDALSPELRGRRGGSRRSDGTCCVERLSAMSDSSPWRARATRDTRFFEPCVTSADERSPVRGSVRLRRRRPARRRRRGRLSLTRVLVSSSIARGVG